MLTHRPALNLSLVLALGIWAGKCLCWPLWLVILLTLLSLMAASRHWPIIYGTVFFLGMVLIAQRQLLPLDSMAFLDGKEALQIIAIEGKVATTSSRQGYKTVFDLEINRCVTSTGILKRSGLVRVNLWGGQEDVYEYGQVLRVSGQLKPISEGASQRGFSFRRYLWERGVYWNFIADTQGIKIIKAFDGQVLMATAIKLRQAMINVFYRYLNEREVGFVAALVLGEKELMPNDLKTFFVNTGTAHILAISGMNMAVITVAVYFLMRLCFHSRQINFGGTIIFLLAYAYLSGWSVSVVRASLMSAMVLAAFAFEEEADALNNLGIAAIILLLMEPNSLFDVGFQLSFAAVIGILILFDPCKKLFLALPRFVADSMALSLSAWMGTAAIMAYHFHMMTPISIVANIPIVPLADLIMALGLGLAAMGSVPFLGEAFAGCIKAVLSLMIVCAQLFDKVPYGHFYW